MFIHLQGSLCAYACMKCCSICNGIDERALYQPMTQSSTNIKHHFHLNYLTADYWEQQLVQILELLMLRFASPQLRLSFPSLRLDFFWAPPTYLGKILSGFRLSDEAGKMDTRIGKCNTWIPLLIRLNH